MVRSLADACGYDGYCCPHEHHYSSMQLLMLTQDRKHLRAMNVSARSFEQTVEPHGGGHLVFLETKAHGRFCQ